MDRAHKTQSLLDQLTQLPPLTKGQKYLLRMKYIIHQNTFQGRDLEETHPHYLRHRALSTFDLVEVNKGAREYYYHNLYEALLWYYYYAAHQRINLRARPEMKTCRNQAYFSVIPREYRLMPPEQGMNQMKRVIEEILRYHSGLPKYYVPEYNVFEFTVVGNGD